MQSSFVKQRPTQLDRKKQRNFYMGPSRLNAGKIHYYDDFVPFYQSAESLNFELALSLDSLKFLKVENR